MLKRSALLLATMTAILIVAGCAVGGSKQSQSQAPAQPKYWTPGERLTQPDGLYFFANSLTGWKLVVRGSSAGSEAVDLYGTTDGGRNWLKLAGANMNSPGGSLPATLPAGDIPFTGTKNGVTFLNPATGWMAGTTGADGVDWLYVSHDGGRSWQHQDIDIPAAYKSFQLHIVPPAFFTEKDGVLPVTFAQNNHFYHYLYFTHDGGRTWDGEEPADRGSSGLLQWRYNDPRNGSITVNGTTWQTGDGGYTWLKQPSPGGASTAVGSGGAHVTPLNRPVTVGGQTIPIGYAVGESIIYPMSGGYSIVDNPAFNWTRQAKTAYVKNHQDRKDLQTFLDSPYAGSPEALEARP